MWSHTQKRFSSKTILTLLFALTFYVFLIGLKNIFSSISLPNTYIDGIEISYLSFEEASQKVDSQMQPQIDPNITIHVDDVSVSSSSASLHLKRNVEETLEKMYQHNQNTNIFNNFVNVLTSLATETYYYSVLVYDQQHMNYFITLLADKIDIIGIKPYATLGVPNVASTLEIFPGSIGREVDIQPTIQSIVSQFEKGTFDVEAVVASTAAELNQEAIDQSYSYVRQFLEKEISFSGPEHTKKTLKDQDIISLLSLPEGINQDAVEQTVSEWEIEINRDPINAIFEFDEETREVTSFIPDRPGLIIKSQELAQMITAAINELANVQQSTNETEDQKNINPLPLTTVLPDITLAETNDIGITERIGYGESEYEHSIPNRIHNVALTAEKINNTIVAPGEEFSFNKTLGEVSRATGFKSAYVIRDGRTILGDGGGVCQVSTTVFRALLDAGLEITRRLPHSYRVSYYELDSKPGIDATVYSGNVDLRFKNDTDHYILLHSEADSEHLTMFVEIYGTSDGRTTEIKDHVTYGYRPPLPPEYADDPSLPAGSLRQIDWAAAGISAKFTHIIRDKDGNTISEKEYVSNYRPWAAKFLRGV